MINVVGKLKGPWPQKDLEECPSSAVDSWFISVLLTADWVRSPWWTVHAWLYVKGYEAPWSSASTRGFSTGTSAFSHIKDTITLIFVSTRKKSHLVRGIIQAPKSLESSQYKITEYDYFTMFSNNIEWKVQNLRKKDYTIF